MEKIRNILRYQESEGRRTTECNSQSHKQSVIRHCFLCVVSVEASDRGKTISRRPPMREYTFWKPAKDDSKDQVEADQIRLGVVEDHVWPRCGTSRFLPVEPNDDIRSGWTSNSSCISTTSFQYIRIVYVPGSMWCTTVGLCEPSIQSYLAPTWTPERSSLEVHPLAYPALAFTSRIKT